MSMFDGIKIPDELLDKLNEMVEPYTEGQDFAKRTQASGQALAVAIYAAGLEKRIVALEAALNDKA